MSTSRIFHSYHLDISRSEEDRICYIILPEKLKESEKPWLDGIALRCRANMVVISGLDWNRQLTPWKVPPLKGCSFGGEAPAFLESLCSDLFFNVESTLMLRNPRRYLCGVSLSGLFGVWAAARKAVFDGIGSVSGSLWYEGFVDWLASCDRVDCGFFYFSLGEKEKDGRNARLAGVEDRTREVMALLRSRGKTVQLEFNEGNHFGPLIPRMEKAIVAVCSSDL